MDIQEIIAQIRPLDQDARQAARTRQSDLTKPPGSLGRLEELSILVAGITANPQPRLVHKVVLIMAGDHGVVAKEVSAYPQAVTAQMVANFLHGGAAINGLARHVGARVVVVDMGIGNTTPSAAIAAAVTGQVVEEIAGRGTGVDESGLRRKIEAIIAVCLAPTAREYLIAAYTSLERGHHLMMDWLGVRPLLNLQMRLGEGTGAALAMSLIEAACKTLSEMATFSEAGVSERDAA